MKILLIPVSSFLGQEDYFRLQGCDTSTAHLQILLNLQIWVHSLLPCNCLPSLWKSLLLLLNSYNYTYVSSTSIQFSSVTQSCLTLCNHMDCSIPDLPVHHQLPELAQTHVHGAGDASQPSHPPLSPSPPAFNLAQHQGLFQWVSSSYQVAKGLKFQLQHQSFQWIFRIHFL